MADSEYPTPDDLHFAGLVQAATAAADESQSTSSLGKRKRGNLNDIPIDVGLTAQGQEPLHLQNSAAVLFREPSVKSKKYSRPPLGKVYASLELAPESFLKLQAAGKEFMLHPSHPERRDVVGHRRHSGGTDVAKLKLWNCVEEFLKDAGNGQRFFAHGAGLGIPGTPERTIFWPEDAQKIIKACMPLMRKMVTNERQRLYASTTRKSGVPTRTPSVNASPGPQQAVEESTAHNIRLQEDDISTPVEPEIQQPVDTTTMHESINRKPVSIYVNLMTKGSQNQKRLIPRFSLSPESGGSLATLRQEVKKKSKGIQNLQNANLDTASVKVWMTDGLVPIVDDGQWMVALLSAETVEWMDNEVRVLVEV